MAELQNMKQADIARCGEIYRSAFHPEEANGIAAISPEAADLAARMNDFDFAHYFLRFIEENDKFAYCITEQGTIIGYLTALEIPNINGGETLYIDSIAIDPAQQQKGFGSDAMKAFMEMFPGAASFRLMTRQEKPAYHMYEKLGFEDTKTTVMEKSEMLDDLTALARSMQAGLMTLQQQREVLQQQRDKLQQLEQINADLKRERAELLEWREKRNRGEL